MGKYLSIVIGALVAVVGLILLVKWSHELLFVLRGTVPIMLILGGLIALLAGISELKDTLSGGKEEKK